MIAFIRKHLFTASDKNNSAPFIFILLLIYSVAILVYVGLFFNMYHVVFRLILNTVLILIFIFLERSKLSRDIRAFILPILLMSGITAAAISLGGDFLIYIYSIGGSMISFTYLKPKSISIYVGVYCAATAAILFGFNINLLGESFNVVHNVLSLLVITGINVLVCVLCKTFTVTVKAMTEAKNETEIIMKEKLEYSIKFSETLAEMTKLPTISAGFLNDAADVIAKEGCLALETSRIGIWRYVKSSNALKSVTYYDSSTGKHKIQDDFDLSNRKKYLKLLDSERMIVMNNIHECRVVFEYPYGEDYLNAALDAPIRSDGNLFGVICVEQGSGSKSEKGRIWTIEEQNFVSSLADLMALAISGYERRIAHEIAEEANRSKSKFLATISHEIRTPMNAIIGIAQIELQKEDLPDEYADAFGKVYSAGNSLLGIINDILDMSKVETGKLELNTTEYDVPSLINDAIQLNIIRIGSKQIEFIVDINERIPSKLFGDELRLKQILNNLLSNAIKYTEKGYVKLSARHEENGGDITLHFAVEDTGQGIKPEDAEQLFSEFVRFNADKNRATEGTGLGLSITKRLVDMMSGKINVRSKYGTGSLFTVTVKQGAIECTAIGKDLAERLRNFTYIGDRQNGRHLITREIMPYGSVLVVDDVDTNLYVAEGLLSPYKLKIETTSSGFAAMEKVVSGNVYDVIFMDHMMPQMDGIEATAKLRGLGYTGVIIALTANALAGNSEMFEKHGFDGFIPKPIDIRQLNTVLNKYIRDRYPEEAKKYKPEEVTANNDSTEIDLNILRAFVRDAGKAVTTLRETASGGDFKLFTTTAHAMKSALMNIGERTASVQASALERAGLRSDADFISLHANAFIKTLENLKKSLTPGEADADDASVTEDTVYLKEQLEIIKSACKNYDDDAAYIALNSLKERTWKAQTLASIEEIRDMLYSDSDFSGAAQRVEQLIKQTESG